MIPPASSQFNQLKVRNLIAAYLVIHFGVGVILGIFGATELLKRPDFSLIIYVLGIVATCVWAMQRCGQLQISIDDIVGTLPKQTRWLKLTGLTIAVTSFSLGTALVILSSIQVFFPDLVKTLIANNSLDANQGNSLLTYIWNFIALVAVAPITEEFLFRGIILNRWREKWGAPRALIGSSLLFGFLHPHPIGLSMFGLVMGLLYLRDKTLWTPVFCHILNNLFAFVSIVLSGSNPDRSDLASQLLPNLIGGALISAIALGFLGRFIARNFPNNQTSR